MPCSSCVLGSMLPLLQHDQSGFSQHKQAPRPSTYGCMCPRDVDYAESGKL